MSRKEILLFNNIEIIVSDCKKYRTLRKGDIEHVFPYHYTIKLKEIIDLFGSISYSNLW